MYDAVLGNLEEVVAAHHSFDRQSGREGEMTRARVGVLGILCGVIGTSMLYAGDLSSYRGSHFDMKRADDERLALEKARSANKPTFVDRAPRISQSENYRTIIPNGAAV